MDGKGAAPLIQAILWVHETTTTRSCDTITPELLVIHAGDIEFESVSMEIKTQRTKHAVAWLLQKPDQYFAA